MLDSVEKERRDRLLISSPLKFMSKTVLQSGFVTVNSSNSSSVLKVIDCWSHCPKEMNGIRKKSKRIYFSLVTIVGWLIVT